MSCTCTIYGQTVNETNGHSCTNGSLIFNFVHIVYFVNNSNPYPGPTTTLSDDYKHEEA